jgi:hypothetical protein
MVDDGRYPDKARALAMATKRFVAKAALALRHPGASS